MKKDNAQQSKKNYDLVTAFILFAILICSSFIGLREASDKMVYGYAYTGTKQSEKTHKVIQNNDPWLALFQQVGLSEMQIRKHAPHFPKYNSVDFKKEKQNWIDQHISEAIALLDVPEIAALSPAHIALGVDGRIPRKEILNPYWYRYNNTGVDKNEAQKVAPHYPQPDRNLSIAEQEIQFQKDYEAWLHNYSNEWEAFEKLLLGDDIFGVTPM